jgi:Mn2+/Fe2+ NRAMP family transporter
MNQVNRDVETAARDSRAQAELELLQAAERKGLGARLAAYVKLSGPGWLQSAITLGGGSLSSSLYLGVLAGFSLLWLQPLAMIFGVIMLSSIAYVTLSTGERPFRAINKHVNPVLGWGWAIATLLANMVWCMPQYSLGVAAIRQNLLPGLFGAEAMDNTTGNLVVAGLVLVITVAVVWAYDSGWRGVRWFERTLKAMVAVVVVCFFGVVARMAAEGALDWAGIIRGFVPDLSLLWSPASSLREPLAATGEFAAFWTARILAEQRDVMISSVATAVGINMTFLLPYSMLRRGWGREHRGLAIFDLSTALFVPFVLAISCVIIASASQFHAVPQPGLLSAVDQTGRPFSAPEGLVRQYRALLDSRVQAGMDASGFGALDAGEKLALREALPEADKRVAAMLVRRDAFNLAESLQRLTGEGFAHYVFGIGVVGMAISSIIILMLISGFVICEMLGLPATGWPHRLGCLAACVGVLGPFVYTGKTQFWLAVPTSVFGMTLLPIAYFTFLFMMNSRSLMGAHMPRGARRVGWNTLLVLAAGAAAFGSLWSIWNKTRWYGLTGLAAFVLLAGMVHLARRNRQPSPKDGSQT